MIVKTSLPALLSATARSIVYLIAMTRAGSQGKLGVVLVEMAYVTLTADHAPSEDLRKQLIAWVRREIGPFAAPDAIQWAPGLPKTRSGKIMRRILRKVAEGEVGSLGDTSTLADPSVVDDLVKNRVGG